MPSALEPSTEGSRTKLNHDQVQESVMGIVHRIAAVGASRAHAVLTTESYTC